MVTVPVRPTEFAHLRDGFTRSLLNRMKSALKMGTLSQAEAQRISTSIEEFKSIFPSGKIPKGQNFLLIKKGTTGELILEYENKSLGSITDPYVAKQLILAYFADQNVISKVAKESVAAGLEQLLEH